MKSQKLVVDLVRNWLPTRNTVDYIHHKLDTFDIVVANSIPDYPGMERIEGVVVWDHLYALDDPRNTERDALVHELFRKFAVATGRTINNIKHLDRMTYVDYKVKELKNVTDFDWIDVPLIKEILV